MSVAKRKGLRPRKSHTFNPQKLLFYVARNKGRKKRKEKDKERGRVEKGEKEEKEGEEERENWAKLVNKSF